MCGGLPPLWNQLVPRRVLMTDEGKQWEEKRVRVAGMLLDRALLRVPLTRETTHPAQEPLLSQASWVCSFSLLGAGDTFKKGTNAP